MSSQSSHDIHALVERVLCWIEDGLSLLRMSYVPHHQLVSVIRVKASPWRTYTVTPCSHSLDKSLQTWRVHPVTPTVLYHATLLASKLCGPETLMPVMSVLLHITCTITMSVTLKWKYWQSPMVNPTVSMAFPSLCSVAQPVIFTPS